MARVTVEDCLDVVENRFALVHATSQRAKQIFRGSRSLVACKNREVVTALREIADAKVTIARDEEEVVKKPARRTKSKN